MKQIIVSISVLGLIGLFSVGCQGFGPAGSLYSSTKIGVYGTTSTAPKKGTACAQSFLGLVAIGDGSVKAAAEQGGISKVSSINLNGMNILFFYSRLCTEVWGE